MQRVSKGIRARRVAAPPPPLRAAMGGSTSFEKRNFDGVACWRGTSELGNPPIFGPKSLGRSVSADAQILDISDW